MLFLLFEAAFLFENIDSLSRGRPGVVLEQFFHVPWEGLRFWDLIQPGFMFIAGVAMTLSLTRNYPGNESKGPWIRHLLIRSLLLLVFGVGLHWMYSGEPVFELQNVLSQLAFTTLLTAIFIRRKPVVQLVYSLVLLVISSAIYRFYSPGSPFIPGENAGTALDVFISGYADSDHWVSLNFLSTSAHTIWGAACGWILLGSWSSKKKNLVLLGTAVAFILIGLIMHFTGFEPIIKRIATVSFVLVSGGICIIVLLVLHLLFDGIRNPETEGPVGFFLRVIGINSLFLYLFSHTVGGEFLYDFLGIYIRGIGSWFNAPRGFLDIVISVAVLGLEWILVWFLYKKDIRVKI